MITMPADAEKFPRISPIRAIIFLLILGLQSAYSHAALINGTAMDVQLDDFQAQNGREFRALCFEVLKKPCGVEEAAGESTLQGKGASPLHLSNTSPRKVLEAILKRFPGYGWANRDGVINIEPKNRGEGLLLRKLDTVSIGGISSFQAARMVLDQAKIPFAFQAKGGLYAPIELELRNVTVRDALNAIVKADGQVMWVFTHSSRESGVKFKGTLTMPSWRKDGIGVHGEAPKK